MVCKLLYRSAREWEEAVAKADCVIKNTLDSLRIPLGNLPDGTQVYVSGRDYDIFIQDPVVERVVSEECGLQNLEEALYSGKVPNETQGRILEKIVKIYPIGLLYFKQIERVPRIPKVVETSQDYWLKNNLS